ncbi:PREDICTED: CD209 antigen-like protein E isoform X2 [Chinchilla lanigera]|uniref:CD209 antigen-like protein E n=1 Tax=Chinchilla lanigera TaxID=34839 RepID=A0A8C2UR00_CHILA|nr:PREDICTED: CD209 antigen-like protein E isoform X2 [Chinchilla lanigera]
MTDSKESRVPQLGLLDEEELITSGARNSQKSFGFRPKSVLSCFAGCWDNDLISLVLQLLSILLFTGLLVAILAQVSKVPSSEEQEKEKSNQEQLYQELNQLKTEFGHLCRPCPWDWTFFQSKCYFFSKSQRDWHESITACKEVGAQLVIVENDEEQSFLQQTSKSKGYAWMGLSDLNKESTWRWVDGSPLSFSLMQYWNKGQPNNYQEQDCVEFRGDGWNDARCNLKKFWICKKPASSCSNSDDQLPPAAPAA